MSDSQKNKNKYLVANNGLKNDTTPSPFSAHDAPLLLRNAILEQKPVDPEIVAIFAQAQEGVCLADYLGEVQEQGYRVLGAKAAGAVAGERAIYSYRLTR